MESNCVTGKITPMQELNAALTACKFGWFHVKLLLVSFVGIVSSVLVTHSTSYLLTSAECDLNMNLVDKGVLNASPYLGSVFSSVLTGFLADTFGRKKFLKFGYSGIFIFTILAGTSQNFKMLVTAKFFEGICFATCLTVVVAFISEFCHDGIRDRIVVCQAAFASFAQVISTVIAWAILPQDWRIVLCDGFVLNTWNFYIFTTSLWSLAAIILLSTLPESPKYLLSQKQYAKARDSLLKVYETNHGKDIGKCPFLNIWESNIKEDLITPEKGVLSLKSQIVVSLRNVKMNFQKSLLILLLTLCLLFFLIMAKYNTIRLWFPQLSTIVEHNVMNGDQDLCVLLDNYTTELKLRSSNITMDGDCIPKKTGSETYINSIIIGLVCIIPHFITGVLVNKIGKKVLLVIFCLISTAAVCGIRWANSKTVMVSLFSLEMAITQSIKCLVQAVAIEFFPTTIRALTLSFVMMFARLGTLVGNILFPILLDMRCVVPFFTMTGMMAFVTLITLILPKKSTNKN